MRRARPTLLLISVAAGIPAAAAPQPQRWTPYTRTVQRGGSPARCLEDRRGILQVGSDRRYVFQIFNDCHRPVQAACDIAYSPNCDYGQDVTLAAHLDARLAPYGESPAFGHFTLTAMRASPGCFFARCSETDPASAPPVAGAPTGLTGH